MPKTADMWAMVTERGGAAQLAIGVLVDMREVLCLIVIPFTSSSAIWNGRNRRNLAAYNELVAALDDGEPAIRELVQDLIHRQSPRLTRSEAVVTGHRRMIGVDVNSQPTLVASLKTGNPQHAMPHAVCKVNAHARFVRERGAAFHRVVTRHGGTGSYRESAC